MNVRLLRETWVMGSILTLDAIFTVVLLAMNRAHEANPIMAFYVQKGLLWFFLVKVGLFAMAPLAVLELFRRMGRELFVRNSLRLGIAAYLMVYFGYTVLQWAV